MTLPPQLHARRAMSEAIVSTVDPGLKHRDMLDLKTSAGDSWMDIPLGLQNLIEATVLNPQYRSDGLLLLADALIEIAGEMFDPRMADRFARIAVLLRITARRRARA